MCCPLCGGIGALLGRLGHLLWLRCRDCGIDFNIDTKDRNHADDNYDEDYE